MSPTNTKFDTIYRYIFTYGWRNGHGYNTTEMKKYISLLHNNLTLNIVINIILFS